MPLKIIHNQEFLRLTPSETFSRFHNESHNYHNTKAWYTRLGINEYLKISKNKEYDLKGFWKVIGGYHIHYNLYPIALPGEYDEKFNNKDYIVGHDTGITLLVWDLYSAIIGVDYISKDGAYHIIDKTLAHEYGTHSNKLKKIMTDKDLSHLILTWKEP